MSWDECPQALQEGFSILPILERDKNLKEGCVRCSDDERGHSEHDEEAQVPRWKSRKPVRQDTLIDSTPPVRDKRRETTRDCGGRKQRSPSGKLVSRVVPREKRMSGDPL